MGKGSSSSTTNSNSISSGIHQNQQEGWSSFWNSLWGSNGFFKQDTNNKNEDHPLGKIWDSFQSDISPTEAFRTGEMKSLSGQGAEKPRIAVRNASSIPLIMCWLHPHNCKPHHFYTIEPQQEMLDEKELGIHHFLNNNHNRLRAENDLTYNNMVTSNDKIENSCVGHSFCFATDYEINDDTGEKYLDPEKIIGGYRPDRSSSKEGNRSFHLLTITSSPTTKGNNNFGSSLLTMSCCGAGSSSSSSSSSSSIGGGLWGLRGSTTAHKENIVTAEEDGNETLEWKFSVREGVVDPTPIDTSKKHYDECMLSGWPVRLETNWNDHDDELKEDLCNDLKALRQYLPPKAREDLERDTPVWVNRSLKYGPKLCPVQASACCFHPGVDWLRENGMNPAKEKCVEVYRSSEYKRDRLWWGVGGLLLHEYSHAYHFKCLPDGYDNKEIRECFESAMEEGLYECVPYHSHDKDAKARAYACTNQMEYFAELSAAFLGGLSETEEFNKWFPFNRQQLKEHDPRAYKLLCRLWHVNDDNNNTVEEEKE